MDESEVVAFVEKNAERMMREFGLPHWRVGWETKALGPDVYAEVRIDPAREQAWIEIDPAQVKDGESLVNTIEHELIHCVVGPFDAFADAAREWIPEGPARESALRVWTDAMERAVRNVERMASGLRRAKADEEFRPSGPARLTTPRDLKSSRSDLICTHPHT